MYENIIENMSDDEFKTFSESPEGMPDVHDGVLRNIELTAQQIEDMPESNEDIVKRVLGKKE